MLISKNIYNKKNILIILAFILMSLNSCTLAKDVATTINRDTETINTALEKSNLPEKPIEMDMVRMRDDIWLGDTSAKSEYGDPLPAELETEDAITIASNRAVNITDILEQISQLSGIPVRLNDALLKEMKSSLSSANKQAPIDIYSLPESSPTEMVISYTGPLSGLLKQVGAKFFLWWTYKNGNIVFYNMDTRTFTVYALPSTQNLSSQISSKSGEGAQVSLANQSDVKLWEVITSTVESMVSEGGKVVADTNSGVITVTASPLSLQKVAQFINEQNRRLARQVAISVKILQVDINDEANYGLDLGAALQFEKADTGLTTTFNGPYTSADGANAVGVNMAIVGATGRHWERWNGTTGIIEALATQGNVSLLTTTTVTTLNNKPAPVQVSKLQSYVAEVSKTSSSSSSSTEDDVETTIKTKELNLGLTMYIMPRILDHGRLLIMFSLNLAELINLEKYSFDDGGSVQLPTIENRGFSQEIALRSGSTLVITGFEKIENKLNKTGLGNPDFTLLGGNKEVTQKRTVLVILLTPQVLETPLSPESRISRF